MAIENYILEKTKVNALKNMDKSYFYDKLHRLFPDSIGNIAFENGNIVGYLAFHANAEHQYAGSPLYGYGIRHTNRGEIIDRLFQNTAAALGENFCKNLRINVYAHDIEVLKTYIMSAFVMDTTDVIRDTALSVNAKTINYIFKEIDKTELLNYRDDVIEFYRNLINHLRASPIFYPCNEFLPVEERFNDFLSDNIRIFTVFDGIKLVGMVISEPSDIELAAEDSNAMNLSDLFVATDYRGKGIAASLLEFASNELKKSGVNRLFVTHGTINPAARGFWDKYFTNYSFSMSRQINSDMLGIIQKV
jgi:GNAT superfamily N-acetyltransferase